jgi:hypothetical protein
MLDHGVSDAFIRPEQVAIVRVFDHPETAAADLLSHLPLPPGPPLLDPAQT